MEYEYTESIKKALERALGDTIGKMESTHFADAITTSNPMPIGRPNRDPVEERFKSIEVDLENLENNIHRVIESSERIATAMTNQIQTLTTTIDALSRIIHGMKEDAEGIKSQMLATLPNFGKF